MPELYENELWRVTIEGGLENVVNGAYYPPDAVLEDDTLLHECGRNGVEHFLPAYFQACKLLKKQIIKIKTFY